MVSVRKRKLKQRGRGTDEGTDRGTDEGTDRGHRRGHIQGHRRGHREGYTQGHRQWPRQGHIHPVPPPVLYRRIFRLVAPGILGVCEKVGVWIKYTSRDGGR